MTNKGMLPPPLDLTGNGQKDLSLCFGCGPANPVGLKLKFSWDGVEARASFTPGSFHQGWPGITHGGVIFAVMDEAMGYVTYYLGLECVTAKFEARIRDTTPIGQPLTVAASVKSNSKRLITVGAMLRAEDGTVMAESTGTMFVTGRHQHPALT
jgi:acyl-coenzyme A thioesterase PaaI-like protein